MKILGRQLQKAVNRKVCCMIAPQELRIKMGISRIIKLRLV